jgi:hypothetical protein
LKLWDARNNKSPVKIWNNLPNNLTGCKIALSPDEKYILTGTSFNKEKNEPGSLRFIDSLTLEEKSSIFTGENGVTDVNWNSTIN